MCIVAAPVAGAAAGSAAAGATAAAAASAAAAGAAATATTAGVAAGASTAATAATSAFSIQSALSLITTLGTFIQQDRNANATEKAQDRAFEQNKALAIGDAINNHNATNLRQAQENARAAVEIQSIVRQSRAASGTARAAGADAGVAGQSLDALLSDFERKAASFTSGTERNLKFVAQQTEATKRGIRSTQEGRILSALPGVVAKPSFFGAALRAGTGIYGAYQDNTFIDPDGNRRFGVLPPTGAQ